MADGSKVLDVAQAQEPRIRPSVYRLNSFPHSGSWDIDQDSMIVHLGNSSLLYALPARFGYDRLKPGISSFSLLRQPATPKLDLESDRWVIGG